MANIRATKNGNWSDNTVWSPAPPTSVDDVFASGFTVFVDINVQVLSINTIGAMGIGGGGTFRPNNGVVMTTNVVAGSTTCVTFGSASPNFFSLVGNVSGGTGIAIHGISNTSTGTINVTGNIYGGSSSGANGINNSSTGRVNVLGNIFSGFNTANGILNSGFVNLTGNINAGLGTNALGINNTSTGIVNIYGNIITPNINIARENGVYNSNAGTMYIYGYVGGNRAESTFTSTLVNTGSAWVYGDIYTPVGRYSRTIHNSSTTSYLFVSGNVYGSSGTTSSEGGITNLGICEVIGNVYGGNAGNSTGGGIYNNRTLSVTGNVYGGHATRGIGNFSPGITTVVGTAYGGPGNGVPGIVNADTGIVRLKRAVGNSWGLGYLPPVTIPAPDVTIYLSTLPTTGPSPGVNGAQNSQTFVEELELGPRGQWPTAGNVYFTPNPKAVSVFETDTFQNYSLIQSNSADNLVPPVSSVRQGEVYNLGLSAGTCIIPPVSSVAAGVLVDNLTGTAVLTPQTTWNYPTTASDVNSMGGRLKNTLTTDAAEKLINSFSA